jgi:hypothetical protein
MKNPKVVFRSLAKATKKENEWCKRRREEAKQGNKHKCPNCTV